MGIDYMGMGGSGNVKSHSRSSLVRTITAQFMFYNRLQYYLSFNLFYNDCDCHLFSCPTKAIGPNTTGAWGIVKIHARCA